MADVERDAEDRWLESVFASGDVPDDGFSDAVVRRIRRRVHVRRWSLGVALVFGTAVAAKPVLDLVSLLLGVLGRLAGSLGVSPVDSLPSAAMLAAGGVLFLAAALGLRLLDN